MSLKVKSFGSSIFQVPFLLVWLATANAHLAAFHVGMYCLNGTQPGYINYNTNDMVKPLYQLPFEKWWLHHDNGCDEFPPAPGQSIDLPAGGSFKVEIASNRGKTSLSFGGKYTSDWPDGNTYPEDYNVPTCIISPNMHAQNQSMAAGTAFAISYQSDIKKVTPENLVVFSVRYHTPWKRITTYDVPAAMPPCPPGGCICAWGWIPNGCGEPNMFQQPFSCNVSKSTSTTPLATAKPPTWCEGDPSSCTKGAKQMIYWHQKSGNNIEVDGFDLSGANKSPGYNHKCGFNDGAQNDIFATSTDSGNTSTGSGNTSTSSVNTSTSSVNTSTSSVNISTSSGNTSTSSGNTSTSSASTSASSSKCKRSVKSISASASPSNLLSLKTNKRRLIAREGLDDVENHIVPETPHSDTTLIDGISSHKRLLGRVGRGQH